MNSDRTDRSRPSGKFDDPIVSGSSTSHSLLERLKNDDTNAWGDVVSLYSPLVYCWCRRSRIADQDILDIVQEVFQAVAINIKKFRKDRAGDSFRGWLRTITRNKIIDFYRRQAQVDSAIGGTDAQIRISGIPEVLSDNDEHDEDTRAAEHALFHRALELIRSEFQPQTWQAFWRVVVDECTPNEVADELNMRPGAVRVAKSRVLQKLRQRLGDIDD